MWVQFAKCLGDESLDNVSMLASDIKEATEATQTNPIARAKLRLIHAVARVMHTSRNLIGNDVQSSIRLSASANTLTSLQT